MTSSKILVDKLRKSRHCKNHGGTRAAGHYPPRLANLIVECLEEQRLQDNQAANEVMVGETEGDDGGDVPDDSEDSEDEDDDENPEDGAPSGPGGGSQETSKRQKKAVVPTREQRAAVMRLRQNTGHRDPKRLARALVLAGASPEVVKAAREIKCDICQEHRKPRAHRPSFFCEAPELL